MPFSTSTSCLLLALSAGVFINYPSIRDCGLPLKWMPILIGSDTTRVMQSILPVVTQWEVQSRGCFAAGGQFSTTGKVAVVCTQTRMCLGNKLGENQWKSTVEKEGTLLETCARLGTCASWSADTVSGASGIIFKCNPVKYCWPGGLRQDCVGIFSKWPFFFENSYRKWSSAMSLCLSTIFKVYKRCIYI